MQGIWGIWLFLQVKEVNRDPLCVQNASCHFSSPHIRPLSFLLPPTFAHILFLPRDGSASHPWGRKSSPHKAPMKAVGILCPSLLFFQTHQGF